MTPQTLERAGKDLFGDTWKARIAEILHRDPKSIQRYMTDDADRQVAIPIEHKQIIIKALQGKIHEIKATLFIVLHEDEDGSISMGYVDPKTPPPDQPCQ